MPARRVSGPYLPRADGALRDWMNNFASVVARRPGAVMLTEADAAMLLDLAARYEAAYAAANGPASRGPSATAAKNALRRELWQTVRPLAMRIKHNLGIERGLKLALGIRSPRDGQTRIGPPRTRPVLTIVKGGALHHRLRYHDIAEPLRMAKPHNVTELELRICLGRRAVRDPAQAQRLQKATRHLFNVLFEPRDRGRTATYFGRWITRRGLAGPWSAGVSMIVA